MAQATKKPGPAARAILAKFQARQIDSYAAQVMLRHFGYTRPASKQMLRTAAQAVTSSRRVA